jgi:hypothetical protein
MTLRVSGDVSGVPRLPLGRVRTGLSATGRQLTFGNARPSGGCGAAPPACDPKALELAVRHERLVVITQQPIDCISTTYRRQHHGE